MDRDFQPLNETASGALRITSVYFSLIFIVGMSAYSSASEEFSELFNTVSPILILFGCLYAAFALVVQNVYMIVTPIPWLYVGFSLYFGVGALVWPFGDAITIAYIQRATRLPIDAFGLYRANLMSCAGIALISLFLILFDRVLGWAKRAPLQTLKLDMAQGIPAFWAMILVGGVVKYLILIPASFGSAFVVVPSVIAQLSVFLQAAIIAGFLLVANGARHLRPVLSVLILTELMSGFMSGSKSAILFVILSTIIGWCVSSRSLRGPGLLGGLTILFYSQFLTPYISYVRSRFERGGTTSFATFSSATSEFLDGARTIEYLDVGARMWWARLSFASYQNFALREYDFGRPGESLNEIMWALVPRIFFPDKQSVGYGAQLSDILNPGSSAWTLTSMTWLAEGYWNLGITGLVLVCFGAALILSLFTRIIVSTFLQGQIAFALITVLSIQTAISVESWYVQTYIGGGGLIFAYAVVAYYITRVSERNRATQRLR
jgi:hypothetical protein